MVEKMGAAMKLMTLVRYGLFAVALGFLTTFAATGQTDPYWDGFYAYHYSQDYKTALRIWLPLAEQGNAGTQWSVGSMYEEGRGTPQDYAEAAKWYRKAAEQGNEAAQWDLGALYAKGQGVTQDYIAAHMWFSLAAAQGDEMSREERDRVAKAMSPAQIAEAQRLAREWMTNHGK